MQPQRISIKYFVDGAVDATALVPTFHRWIQQSRTADTLIDVADYKHVQDGPHTVLISHEADYVIDFAEGRPGLRYVRKRPGLSGTLADRLRATLRGALVGAKTLADDPEPHGPIAFDTGALEVRLLDRLHTPNTADAYEAIRGDLEAVLGEAYEGGVTLERSGADDPRHPLTVQVKAAEATSLDTLVERTVGAATGAG